MDRTIFAAHGGVATPWKGITIPRQALRRKNRTLHSVQLPSLMFILTNSIDTIPYGMEPARLILLSLVERHSTLLRTAIRRLGNVYRLQPVHVQALMYLQQANRYSNTTQALTEFLGLTKGTVSQSVMLLSRKRLIERYMDERDKRIVRLSLSAKGERLLLELQLALDWQAATRDITSARLKSATRVLRDTLHALQIVNGGRSFGNCHNCEFYWKEGSRIYRCGFTGERLSSAETYKICRLHSPA